MPGYASTVAGIRFVWGGKPSSPQDRTFSTPISVGSNGLPEARYNNINTGILNFGGQKDHHGQVTGFCMVPGASTAYGGGELCTQVFSHGSSTNSYLGYGIGTCMNYGGANYNTIPGFFWDSSNKACGNNAAIPSGGFDIYLLPPST